MSSSTKELPISWDGGLIFISYCTAVQAAYVAIQILQLRVNRWMLIIAAMCLSVSGIWSMHFVGMAAMSIDANVSFDIWWTVASALFAFLPCTCGLLLAGEKVAHTKLDENSGTKAENLKAIADAPHLWLILSGACIALGVCAMHYTGMHAMSSEATAVLNWGVIAASCLVALFAATAALYFALVLPITREYTFPTSLIAGIAVCGMHYTGMYGMTYELPTSALVIGKSNSLKPTVSYILLGSWVVSFASQALATHMYQRKLRNSEKQSENGVTFAKDITHLLSGYDMAGAALVVEQSCMVDMDSALREQFTLLLERLEPYRAYLPHSLFAKDESSDEDQEPDQSHRQTELTSQYSSSSRSSQHSRSSRRARGITRVKEVVERAAFAHKNVSLLVVNVRAFHDILSKKGTGPTTDLQSSLVDICTKAAAASRGVVDSFQGDHITLSFNAATNVAAYQRRAAITALTIRDEVQQKKHNVSLSMGVASGEALVGAMGSHELRRFCIIGRVVPRASALERLCKQYDGVSILMLDSYAQRLGGDFRYENVDCVPAPFFTDMSLSQSFTRGLRGGENDFIAVSALQEYEDSQQYDWMYDACKKANPYDPINAAFDDLVGRTELLEDTIQEIRSSIQNAPSHYTARRFEDLFARIRQTGTPTLQLGKYFNELL